MARDAIRESKTIEEAGNRMSTRTVTCDTAFLCSLSYGLSCVKGGCTVVKNIATLMFNAAFKERTVSLYAGFPMPTGL